MAGIQAGGTGKPSLETELDERGIVARVFFAPVRKIFIGRLAANDDVPALRRDDLFEFARRFAGGVETANQAAHAGASDVVHRDVMVFEPLQDANVGETEGAAAFEGYADLGAWAWFRLGT